MLMACSNDDGFDDVMLMVMIVVMVMMVVVTMLEVSRPSSSAAALVLHPNRAINVDCPHKMFLLILQSPSVIFRNQNDGGHD